MCARPSRGLTHTLKHMLNPEKVTTQYPEEKESISKRWRGTHRMLTTEDGKAKCVGCGLCPSVCPANCIKLVPGEDEEGNRYPLVFEIDEFRCIFCGYCQEVCPEEAIRRPALRECRVQPRGLRLRSRALDGADASGLRDVGSSRSQGGVMTHNELPLFYVFNFYLFGLIGIVSAIAFVTRKSPVAAALWLVNTMFCLAALYVMLDAQFIGIMQVLVYAGAIMVVFLFVVMLLNLGHPSELADARGSGGSSWRAASVSRSWRRSSRSPRRECRKRSRSPRTRSPIRWRATGAIAPIAGPLFRDYLLAFEVTSVLLLAAVVGAVVLGKRKERAHAR